MSGRTGAKRRLVLIAAGGTGGHMFPAEAAARALVARGHGVLLVTDKRGAQHADKFEGAEVSVIAAGGIAGRGLAERAAAALRLAVGFVEARALIARKKPDAAFGFGGYASLPTMAAALLAGVPAALHEQNAVLGRANRLLAPRMRLFATAFETTRFMREADRGRVVVTGSPVRAEIAAVGAMPYPASGERVRLLIIGGSQGARVFGRVVPQAIAALPELLRKRIKIAQQARPEDLDAVVAAYRSADVEAEVSPFFKDMADRLAACHLLIARAGASTCAELTAAGRPAILVPYPHAIDDHQTANAQAITRAGAAWVMPEGEFTPERLGRRLEELVSMPEALLSAAKAARAAGRADAAERLASVVERLLPANGNNGAMREAAA
ncbi:MAG TPA: undecaprenyldiphospho-muramoylpentapeptide beta-N-acetylglucosaminyltransferase [Alphaproteobacteria bacterium]|nr:undecaprenyldiphospho-muramoylpentapeptide beta-N-acetylglucosaminyltransferase [Alphaproteobacteria bacterium]